MPDPVDPLYVTIPLERAIERLRSSERRQIPPAAMIAALVDAWWQMTNSIDHRELQEELDFRGITWE